jgi:hypothetical protein
LVVVAILAAPLVITLGSPTALAHNCQQASGCGECKDGENHNHQDAAGNCQSARTPIPGVLLALVSLAGVALALRR